MSEEFYDATLVDKLIVDYFANEKRSFGTLKGLLDDVLEIKKARQSFLFEPLVGLEGFDRIGDLHMKIA